MTNEPKEGKLQQELSTAKDNEDAEALKVDYIPEKMEDSSINAGAATGLNRVDYIPEKMKDSGSVNAARLTFDYIPEKMNKDSPIASSSVLRYKGYLDNNNDVSEPNAVPPALDRHSREQTYSEPGAYPTRGVEREFRSSIDDDPQVVQAPPNNNGVSETATSSSASPPVVEGEEETSPESLQDEGLAVAHPVSGQSQQDFPRAEHVPDPQEQRRRHRGVQTRRPKSQMSQDNNRFGYVVATVVLVIISGAVTLIVVFLNQGTSNKKETSVVPATDPANTNTIPQTQPTAEDVNGLFVKSVLPGYTLDAMEDQSSPQYLAYQWVLQDPSLSEYPDWRILQRFSLATLFLSTDGFNSWRKSSGWLDYNVHECLWWGQNFQAPPGMEVVDIETGNYLPPDFVYPDHPNPCELAHPVQSNITMNTTGIYQNLYLWGAGMKGILPREVFLLTHLRGLAMMINPGLTGELTSELGLLTKLRGLSFGKTSLGGSIPTEIGLLTKSLLFHLPLNRLRGTIPTEIGLNSLSTKWLRIDYTNISGTLPSQVGSLTNMDRLLLSRTGLSGSIPTQLGQLASSMKWMEFGQTKMNGTVPSQLGLLSKLTTLHLQGCSLSGSFPWEELSHLAKGNASNHIGSLVTLNLTGNELISGTIPMEICSGVETLSFDCTGQLCGCGCQCTTETSTAGNKTGQRSLLRRTKTYRH